MLLLTIYRLRIYEYQHRIFVLAYQLYFYLHICSYYCYTSCARESCKHFMGLHGVSMDIHEVEAVGLSGLVSQPRLLGLEVWDVSLMFRCFERRFETSSFETVFVALAWGKDFEDFLKIQRRTLSNLPYQLCRACGLANEKTSTRRVPQDVFHCLPSFFRTNVTVQGPDLLCWITMARWQSRQREGKFWSFGAFVGIFLKKWTKETERFSKLKVSEEKILHTTLTITWYTDIPTWSWPDLSRNVPWPAANTLPMTHWPWHGRCLNILCVRESPKFPPFFLARCVPL